MSDYMPSTEEVWEWVAQSMLPGQMDETRAEFHRWLADRDARTLEDAAEAWVLASGDPEARPARWLRSRAEVVRRGANPNPPA